MENPPTILITTTLFSKILGYLVKQPYEQVHLLIEDINKEITGENKNVQRQP